MKLAIIAGLVVLLLAVGYATPPEIRRATSVEMATFEAKTEAAIDSIPSPSFDTWKAIGDPWAKQKDE